jgi:hypothetical protein
MGAIPGDPASGVSASRVGDFGLETWRFSADSPHGAPNIQKNFAARTRVVVAAISLVIAGGIAVGLMLAGFGLGTLAAWFAVGVLLLALMQARLAMFGVGLGVIGLVGALEIGSGAIPVIAVPLLGATLLAAAEYGYWSFELQMTVAQSSSAIMRRAAVIMILVLVGAVASTVCITLADLVASMTAQRM